MSNQLLVVIALICVFKTSISYADETNGIEYSGSGFMSLAVGKMLGGTTGNVGGYNCPCYVADYAQAAMYDGRGDLQWAPDSKLGLQGSIAFDNQRFSLTAQAISRGVSNGSVNLEWLYGSYKLNSKITLQAGLQRLQMFYYSDSQDIGFALPWTHLPTWLYGWQSVNYNGASMRYQDQFGEWSAIATLFGGNKYNNDSGYWKVYGNGAQSITSVNWTNIIGSNLTLSKDWFETRIVYMQSNTQDQPVSNSFDFANNTYDIAPTLAPVAKQQIYGLTAKVDYQNWLLYTEFIHINHPGLTYTDFAQNIAVGYRYGKWLPMVTWGQYKGSAVTAGVLPNAPQSIPNSQQTTSLSLRYDLTASSDLKMEFDSTIDQSDPGFTPLYGSSSLLTLAYDRVF